MYWYMSKNNFLQFSAPRFSHAGHSLPEVHTGQRYLEFWDRSLRNLESWAKAVLSLDSIEGRSVI